MFRWLDRVITFSCTLAIATLLSVLVRSPVVSVEAPVTAPNPARGDAGAVLGSHLSPTGEEGAIAQLMIPNRIQTRYRTNDMWQLVYQAMPELPLENQYTNIETGEPETNHTLMRRLIRYHIYVKNRPPVFRLDWKLTLADYLTVRDPSTGELVSANERISAGTYPGNDTLNGPLVESANGLPQPLQPVNGDRAAIARLTPAQRDRLLDVLTALFNPTYVDAVLEHAATAAAMAETGTAAVDDAPSGGRELPRAPQAGDAELLIPGAN